MRALSLLLAVSVLLVSPTQTAAAPEHGTNAKLRPINSALRNADRAAFRASLEARGKSAAAKLSLAPGEALPPREAAAALSASLAEATLLKRPRLAAVGTKLFNVSTGQLSCIGGGVNDTAYQCLGVPFGAPPVGPLRWKAPQPPLPWSGVRDATWFAPSCLQSEWYWAILSGMSEDCLNANIYIPSKPAPPGGFPVIVFWYGGSFTFGGASFPLYDYVTDVSMVEDVILIAANYRLSVFGFLAGDELKAESADGSVGVYGFQDQQRVLAWVQKEIAAFGGNPARVTIQGESAGGASVTNHLVAPGSRGLFAGAIIESGSPSDWSAQPYSISRTRLPQVAANLGCSGTGAALLACLRAVNETALLNADHGLTKGFLEWSPTIDGVVVLDDPRVLVAAGQVAPVPVLLGFNHDEGTLFNSAPTNLNASQYVGALATIIGEALAEAVAAEYPLASEESPWWAICSVLRDSQMLCPGTQAATWLSAPARTQPAYVYYYNQILVLVDIIDLFRNLRVFHGSELVSVFDFTVLLWDDAEVAMAKAFVGYFTNFAVTGNPATGPAPVPAAWPAFGAAGNVAVIQAIEGPPVSAANITIVQNPQADKCAWWALHPINASVIWG